MFKRDFGGKKVLVTGGLGFIGSTLTHRLVEVGARVSILDALLTPYGGNKFNIKEIEDRVELVNGNITDEETVTETVRGKDFIFHLAGQVGYLDAKEKPFVDLDFNGRGNLIVLEAVKEQAPGARILFSSSRMVYGKIKEVPVLWHHQGTTRVSPLRDSIDGLKDLLLIRWYSLKGEYGK